eukprot:TRINITY_DN38339_c0_g1_i1.p1 TRINITY_DN38339_c0_g1~~TRINITY_DN38339_c0_g1_i1.p1  ORF type:complete len:363 (-),score=81.58 TRINITY_DN38339_c0_g1_i1:22-1110(-)
MAAATALGGAKDKDTESPAALLKILQGSADLSTVCWAAAGIQQQIFSSVNAVPESTAAVLIQSFASLGGSGKPWPGARREVASPLLGAFVELLMLRAEDRQHFRSVLLHEASTGNLAWMGSWLELVAVPASDDIGAALGGGAFAYSCQALEIATKGDEELTAMLHKLNVLSAVGTRLLAGVTAGDEEARTSWIPFATSAVALIDALVGEEDPDRFTIQDPKLFRPVWTRYHRPEAAVKGIMAALERSLTQEAQTTTSAMPLQVSAMRALGHILRLSEQQAVQILRSKATEWSVRVVRLAGTDEEATVAALQFLVQVALKAPKLLASAAAPDSVRAAAARFPRSEQVQQMASRILEASGEPKG